MMCQIQVKKLTVFLFVAVSFHFFQGREALANGAEPTPPPAIAAPVKTPPPYLSAKRMPTSPLKYQKPSTVPCAEDIVKYCPHLVMGKGLGACLGKNLSKFDSTCQAFVGQRTRLADEVAKACKKDWKVLCNNAEFEYHTIEILNSCLKGRWSQVSSECQIAIGNLEDHKYKP